MIENQLDLDIVELVEFSLAQFTHSFDKQDTQSKVVDFIFDRLKGYSLDHGYKTDEFDAVIAVKPRKPLDFMQRLQAVKAFRQLPEAKSLAAANKRIINILKKSDTQPASAIDNLVETQEKTLLEAANSSAKDIKPLLKQKNYQATLTRLALLKDDVDAFFDNVMVNTEDLQLRASRLALLSMLSKQFLKIADISRLQ